MQTSDPSALANLAKRHADELRELETRLTAKHQQEIKTAIDAAIASAQKPVPSTSGSEKDSLEATMSEYKAKLEQTRAEEIAAAVERGRMEQSAKAKLKDSQLVRAQSKLKDLEAQVLEWRKAGIVPSDALPSAPAGPSTANPSTPVTGSATLNRKPSLATPTSPATVVPVEGVGRGRGIVRGAVRGVQRGLGIRGAAPGRGSPAASPTTTMGGVSILGAAGKRTREEGEGAPDDSLAKRLKPAEGGGTGTGTGKPVTLRRPPPAS
jgi:nucleoprotein TPR